MPIKGGGGEGAVTSSTALYREHIRRTVKPEVAKEIELLARDILDGLPKTDKLGSLGAGLMLAALAFAEGARNAKALIE